MKNNRKKTGSLASSSGFETFVVDQLADLGDLTATKMFGGVGLYCGDVFFGIVARGELYLKVDDSTRGAFEAAGAKAFRPYRARPGTMRYYSVPLDVLESGHELVRSGARRRLRRPAERQGREARSAWRVSPATARRAACRRDTCLT